MERIDQLADRHDRLYKRHKGGVLGEKSKHSVTMVGDSDFLRTYSGQITWATLLNVVARLYKGLTKIQFALPKDIKRLPVVFFPNDLTNLYEASFQLLKDLTNGYVELEDASGRSPLDIVVVVGGKPETDSHRLSLAGRGWSVFVDHDGWRSLPDDGNPIGPMAAACFGAAEVYKLIYSAKAICKEPFVFSAFDYSDEYKMAPEMPQAVHLPRTYIPGAGAIGMGFLLALEQTRNIESSGGLIVVDDDRLDDTNLNRCVLALLDDTGHKKTEIIEARLGNSALNLKCYDDKWQTFIKAPEHANDKDYELVVSCVDKYDARLATQYAKVPKMLLTAGTGDFLLTVSRHVLNDGLSCGLCYQARDAQTCATASDGAQQVFIDDIDPSIGFVSVLAATLLAGEYLKQTNPDWALNVIRNTVRMYVLFRRLKKWARAKDSQCNCSSKHVVRGYEILWKP